IARILLEVFPGAQPTEFERAKLEGIADAKFMLRAPDIGEWSEFIAAGIEELHCRKRRSVLRIAGITEAELNPGLGQENQVVILHPAAGVAEVAGFGDGQAAAVVFVEPPQHVVATEPVLLSFAI